MGITDSVKEVYVKIENKFYDLMDSVEKAGLPVYKIIDPLEANGIPAFPAFVLLLLALIGIIFFLFIYK